MMQWYFSTVSAQVIIFAMCVGKEQHVTPDQKWCVYDIVLLSYGLKAQKWSIIGELYYQISALDICHPT